MKRFFFLIFLCLSSYVHAADVSCNERARQGRIGLTKALLTVASGIGLYHMMGELWDVSEPARTGKLQIRSLHPEHAWKKSGYTALVLTAVGYLTHNLATESYQSLKVFFTDDDETEIASEDISSEVSR